MATKEKKQPKKREVKEQVQVEHTGKDLPVPPPRLRVYYENTVRDRLMSQFGFTNVHQIPTLEKIVINCGAAVTLRGARMWEFLDRFVTVAIPRIRDFRGVNTRSFDGRGNYTLGVKEQMIFPEINYDMVEQIHGMDITFVTTTNKDDQAFALLRELGMPFRGDDKPIITQQQQVSTNSQERL